MVAREAAGAEGGSLIGRRVEESLTRSTDTYGRSERPLHEEPAEHPRKLLFVCSRNRIRSLTAEQIFRGLPGLEVRSVGTQPGARIVVTAGHLGWADLILVMEKSHLGRLRAKFPEELAGKRIVTLLIPDDYEYMQPELIEELYAKVGEHIPLPD